MTRRTWLALAIVIGCPATVGMASSPVIRMPVGAFSIDRTEVTVGSFRAFARATGLTTAAERDGGGFEFASGWTRRPGWTYERPQGAPGSDDEPATHVTWGEASRYCAHAGGRLPTLAEWRQAAYTETRDAPTDGFVKGRTYAYPVGDAPEGMNNNRRSHVPVGTTARGVNGLHEMGANVWEWAADRRGDDAMTTGGSWWYGPAQARADGAQWKPAEFYAVYVGFRCAYDR
ncbi:formylglycine-generating enzyme family protein [uncultured Alsobacter sp.]|uniref:formylglycine-generating enzyme family protein n=1 Tax=uncultured Alsobacter sp. TaxID=1748258 RepID=UPI0025D2FB17|nr:formylglycine-generating enzyme family protein [uncultured Alsobacter sp.]